MRNRSTKRLVFRKSVPGSVVDWFHWKSIISGSLAILFGVGVISGQELGPPKDSEEPPPPTFSTTELKTRPIILEEALKELVVEIEVHRWGKVEDEEIQKFTLQVQSQPEFVENLELEFTSVEFNPVDWVKELKLQFDIRDQTEDEQKEKEGDIVLLIEAEDKLLTPQERKFIIPLRYQPEVPDDGRSIFATTLREDYTGTVDLYEAHLECTEEELTLFTIDPIYIFFKGFPAEERFFYKLIGPDGEEIETMPYLPGEDFGNGVLAALDGAISPMFKALDEFDHVDGFDRPHAAGVYTILASYQQVKEDPLLGEMVEFSDFYEIGTFELVHPKLYFNGLLIQKNQRSPDSPGWPTTIRASGGGNSVSLEANWVKTINNISTPMSAQASVSIDLPNEIMWTRDNVNWSGSVRVSGSTSGQEGERKKSTFGLNYQTGFTLVTNIDQLVETNRAGTLVNRARLPSVRREQGSSRENWKFLLHMPTALYADGLPKRRAGWHLRDPRSIWAITHLIELGGGFGAYGGAYAHAIYRSEPGGIAVLPEAKEEPAGESQKPDDDEIVEEGGREDSAGGVAQTADAPNIPDAGSGTVSTVSNRFPRPNASSSGGSSSRSPASTSSQPRPGNRGPVSGSNSTPSASPARQPGTVEPPNVARRSLPESSPTISPISLTPARSRGGTPEQNQQLEDALSINNPDLVPPDHPRVTEYIIDWIGRAEPPENADPEVNLSYNEWGNVTGQAKGGFIRQAYKPDDAGTLSSSEYLWVHRRALDSLNHCQLGQWVMAQLLGESLPGCSNRFVQSGPVPVPNIIGQSIDNAETTLIGLGLVPIIEIGPPAPNPEHEGTVSGQDPKLGSRIKSGDTVAVEIYTNYTGSSLVPDLVGMTIDQAEQRLDALGFSLELRLGEPAPAGNLQDRIQRQSPSANGSLQLSGVVTLWIYAPYVPKSVNIPDLVGLAETEVRSRLEPLGIKVSVFTGSEAPRPELSGKLEKQQPSPGASIEEGDVMQAWLYSDYIEKVYAPNLVGIQVNEAELIILENGLTLRSLKGPVAPSRELAFTVASQSHQPGAELRLLDEIEVTVYSQPESQVERLPQNQPSPVQSSLPAENSASVDASPEVIPPIFIPPPPDENEVSGDIILVPGSLFGKTLYTGTIDENSSIANPLTAETNRRPANSWAYLDDENHIHGATAIYGTPGAKDSVVFGLAWEEPGDSKSKDINCGAPYESSYFFDNENWTMGRMNSASRRAAVFFISPTSQAPDCRCQLAGLLKQIEAFARPCY